VLKIKNLFPQATLLIFLVTGLVVYDDYGLAWDEYFQYTGNGKAVWNYVSTGDRESYESNPEKYHGPAFELVLIACEKLSGVTTERAIYFQRHLISFLFFWLSGIALYYLLRKKYSDTMVITIAIFWYFLMPRIFADSFYNSKDVPFLAMNMICIYSLYQLVYSKQMVWSALHGIFCGFTIAIRIMGIILPLLTIVIMIYSLIVFRTETRKTVLLISVFIITTLSAMILCWPILWQQPYHHFMQAWDEMSRFPWNYDVLYRGEFINSGELPWHYTFTWIGITTPPIYLLFFTFAVWLLLKNCSQIITHQNVLFDYAQFLLIAIPLTSIILFDPVVYDGWRHLFFIYAPMCLIMIYGLNHIVERLKLNGKQWWILIPVMLLSLHTGYQMIRMHPYQNIYFNKFAGTNAGAVENVFELDYWGLSYREALENLANSETEQVLRVRVANAPGIMNSWILHEPVKNRFEFVSEDDSADYFITNYRWDIIESAGPELIDSIVVDGARISGTYKSKRL